MTALRQKESLTFPVNFIPDYYLGLKINPDGSFQEIYNGPGKLIAELVTNRKSTQNSLHSISISRLSRWNEKGGTDTIKADGHLYAVRINGTGDTVT